ncbi:MAG: hypothetical protein D6690_18100 [Nitrospirae bacterium]|nr:MAG: hypothetical protein D6690_18100 [Nitrospirota bacterium]
MSEPSTPIERAIEAHWGPDLLTAALQDRIRSRDCVAIDDYLLVSAEPGDHRFASMMRFWR